MLEHLKVDNDTVQWIKEFLSNRTQRTVIDGILSESCNIISGVPQGSVLGPLLFLIPADDLLRLIKLNCHSLALYMFADDLKILGFDKFQLQKALSIVESWTEVWQLRIQSSKTEHIFFNKSTSENFTINGSNIAKTSEVNDLGLIIQNDLKWDSYITKIKLKARRISFLILKTFSSSSLDLYKNIFNTYIRPCVEYNTSIWGATSTYNIQSIESVQKYFTKAVSKRLNISFQSYKHRLEIWDMKTLEERRLITDVVLLYKILNGFIDIPPEEQFKKSDFYCKYNLRRHNHCLKTLSISKTNIKNNFFSNRIIQIWNKLPGELVESKSLRCFKSVLKDIDFNKYIDFKIQ